MERLRVLHLIPAENAEILLEGAVHWPRFLDAEKIRFHLARVSFAVFKTIPAIPESRLPVYDLGNAWLTAGPLLVAFLRREKIDILHTHSRACAAWAYPFARLAGVRLFAHDDWGSALPTHVRRIRHLEDQVLKHCQRVASPQASSQKNTFMNPPGIALSSYEKPHQDLQVLPHAVLHVISLDEGVRKIPPAALLAADHLRKDLPELTSTFRPWKTQFDLQTPEKVFALFLIFPGRSSEERRLRVLTTLIAKGLPILWISDKPSLPLVMRDLPLSLCAAHPKAIEMEIREILKNATAFLGRLPVLQAELKDRFRLAAHVELWQMHYEEMAVHRRFLTPTPGSVPTKTPAPASVFSDTELFAHLRCPLCRSTLTAEVSESERGQAQEGLLTCFKNHTFPIHSGVPRLRLPEEELPTPPATSMQDYWRKHFTLTPRHVRSHWRRQIAPILQELQPEQIVLVIHGGSGAELIELARKGARVLAVVPEGELTALHALVRDFPQIRLIQADPLHLPLDDKWVDVVYDPEGGMRLAEPLRELKNLQRVLKPGGELHFFAPQFPLFGPHLRTATRRFSPAANLGLSHLLALSQKVYGTFSPAYSDDYLAMASLWFRLLAYPTFASVDEKLLQQWGEGAGFNNLSIRSMRPLGLLLSAQR